MEAGRHGAIVYHTSLPMRERHLDRLIANCVATVGAEQNVEFAFLTVGDRQPFTMLDPSQPGKQARGKRKGSSPPNAEPSSRSAQPSGCSPSPGRT